METVTSLGKGRTGPAASARTWLGVGLVVVVLAYLAAFGLLRRDHARQVDLTRQGFFVYSSSDEEGTDLARSIRDRTGLPIYDLSLDSTLQRLRSLNLAYEDREPALLLPSPLGWVQIREERTMEEALAPLEGAPTPNLLGSLAALALAAVWGFFAFWRPQIAYLGAAWPAIGLLAIGIATPLCAGCLVDWNGLTPVASLLGIVGFISASLLLGFRNRAPQLALAGVALLSVAAAVAQAYILTLQPKFCPGCVLAGAAWAGTFCLAAKGLAERRVRALLFGRGAIAGIAVIGGLLGFRHAQSALKVLNPLNEPTFEVAVGKTLQDYTGQDREYAKGLYVVALGRCGACELAKDDLRREGIFFRELSFCSINPSRGCVKADFTIITPLLLICDSDGRIQYATAGWTDDPYKRARIFEKLKEHLGNIQ